MFNTKDLQGYKVEGKGEELGTVTDACVDDRHWCVRYLIVDAGGWPGNRRLLLAPAAFARFDPAARLIKADINREQVKGAPPFDLTRPITRRQEADCNRHYGWPDYWLEELANPGPDAYLQSAAACIIVPPPPPVLPQPDEAAAAASDAETHLHSGAELRRCVVVARDGEVGPIAEIWLDDYREGRVWPMHHVEVDAGAWLSDATVSLRADEIKRVDWAAHRIYTGLAREALQKKAQHKTRA